MLRKQTAYTSNLLQELDIGKPISLRVLTGGFIASQLGLSKKNRHIELLSRMGQFQLSKIAHKLSASGLSRLLPKLKVHTRSASGVALPTGLRAAQAFFVGSSSFYIGMLTKHPAQLDLSELEQDAMAELQSAACRTELSGQELEKQNNLPKLEGIALHTEQIELEQSALQNDKIELGRSALHTEQIELHRSALHTEKIELEHTAWKMNQASLPLQPDEGRRAFAALGKQYAGPQLQGKELVDILAFPLLDSKQGASGQSASEIHLQQIQESELTRSC